MADLSQLVPITSMDVGGPDNAPVLQALLDANPNLTLPPGAYAVASTLRLNPAVGRSLEGTFGGRLGPDSPNVGTWLVWTGPAGGTLLDLRGIKCRVRNLGLAAARNTSLDRAVDVETPITYPNVSSQHLFENVSVDGEWGPVAKGWVVGEDGKANHEFMWWRSCLTRYCSYAGVQVPNGTFQSKNHVFEDCTFGGAGQYGVVFATGSAAFWRCNFDALGCAVKWFGGAYEPVHLVDCTGENCVRFLQAGGCYYVLLHGCRLNLSAAPNPQVVGDEFLSGGSNWHVVGCAVEEAYNQNGWFRPNNGATVVIDSVAFHCDSPLSTDLQSGWRGSFRNVRVTGQNNLVAEGPWYQANSPGLVYSGQAVILGDGKWPAPGTFNAGTYTPGPGEVKLFTDGSGRVLVSVGGNPPQALQTVPYP